MLELKKILLAVDGSESSENAAKKTAEMAASLDAEVSLITVIRIRTIPAG